MIKGKRELCNSVTGSISDSLPTIEDYQERRSDMCERSPVFSVVMAVYNGEKFLRDTIDCIINQTFTDWEYVIINDGSTDATAGILEEYAKKDARIRVITNEKNLRLQASLNRGLEAARGKYIVRIDADDLCFPDRFEKQYAYMEANKDIAVSFCRHFICRNDRLDIGVYGRRCEPEVIKILLALYNPVLHPAVVMRREVLKDYRYSVECTCSEDLELWTRMSADGHKIACQNEYLVMYRLHENQITATAVPEKEKAEVAKIEGAYYKKLLGGISEADLKTLVEYIYMREKSNPELVLKFFAWVRQENRREGAFEKKAFVYAVLEWASSNKKELNPGGYLKLFRLCGFRLISEFAARKRRVVTDIKRAKAELEKYNVRKDSDGYIFSIVR